MSFDEELIGKQFGEWVVLKYNGYDGKNVTYLCKCSCGTERNVRRNMLLKGVSKSCGCKRGYYVSQSQSGKPKRGHISPFYGTGEGKTRLHIIWDGMKKRCNCPTDKHYKWYGERGITVCKEWSESFQTFKKWALNNGYRDNLTIDRIDNDGNYCPENCRWVTQKEQCNNTRRNRMISYMGKIQTMTQWSEEIGISVDTLSSRLNLGWSVEKALTTPIRKHKKYEQKTAEGGCH